MDIDDFIDKIFSSNVGKFHGINLHDAITSRLLDMGVNRLFFEKWIEATAAGSGSDEPMDYADTVASLEAGGVQIFFQKSGVSPKLNCNYLATTIDAKYLHLMLKNSSISKYSRLVSKAAVFDGSLTDFELGSFEQDIFDLIDRNPHSDPKGFMEVELANPIKGGSPSSVEKRLVWFTSHDAGDNEASPWFYGIDLRKRTDMVRDVLGLVHFGSVGSYPPGGHSPQLLATLVIPVSSIPNNAKITRPTPLDGVGRRYKSNFGDLRRKPQSWGRTTDLSKIKASRPHRGGRECVIENFIPIGPVKFTILGYTRVPRADWTPQNDNEFLKSLMRKRNQWTLTSRLKGFSA